MPTAHPPFPNPVARADATPGAPSTGPALRWDLFCRVIDNFGDIGVSWRVARRLAALGHAVRLWIDDASAFAWMAPQGAPGVTVLPWRDPLPHETPGDVVVETFGCDPPPAFVEAMQVCPQPPVWVNLEYLSAEGYVERSHRLPSPQLVGPGKGLMKWFFYPGFTDATGGLVLEPGLLDARDGFDAAAWLRPLGIAPQAGVRRVTLFSYEQPQLDSALAAWRRQPTQLLVTPGLAARQIAARYALPTEPGTRAQVDAMRIHFLPWLAQPDFDRLLWSADLNAVRGEDSIVRALWAGRPFLWQLYPQHDIAHGPKLDAFLAQWLVGAPAELAESVRAALRHWNGLGPEPTRWPDPAAWAIWARAASDRLAARQHRGDLGDQLCRFVLAKR